MENLETLQENLNTELKFSQSSLSNSFWETYSSFANTNGGICYLGIKQISNGKNEILGVENPNKIKKELFDNLNNKEKVSIKLISEKDVEVIQYKPNVFVIKITIPQAPSINRPVYINGNIKNTYKRNYEGDYLCSIEQIQSMSLDKDVSSFDSRMNEFDITIDDVNIETFNLYKKYLINYTGNVLLNDLPMSELLDKLGLINKLNNQQYLTNAGVILFTSAAKIQKIYPRYKLDYQEQITNTSKWDYRYDTDDLMYSGNALDFFFNVFNRLNTNLPNRFIANKTGMNEGNNLFQEVIREALVNAISNCDFVTGGIKITKYTDKIILINSGDVKIGLEQAIKGGITVPRNVQIHTIFRRIGFSDKSGTGIPMIFDRCKFFNLPKPLFFVDYDNNITNLVLNLNIVKEQISSFDEEILKIICSNKNGTSKKELMEATGKSSTSIFNSINRLIDSKLVISNNESTNKLKYFPNK